MSRALKRTAGTAVARKRSRRTRSRVVRLPRPRERPPVPIRTAHANRQAHIETAPYRDAKGRFRRLAVGLRVPAPPLAPAPL